MRKTTTLAMLSTAILALAPAAKAQDVNRTGKTDVYLGVLGGLASGTATVTDLGFPFTSQPFNAAELGIVGGVRYNHNDWLLGVEADINTNLSNSVPPVPFFPPYGFTEDDGSGHLRGLVGRQVGPIALFLTGGLAGTHIKYNNLNGGVDDKVMLGWTAGIGAEYAATEHLAVRLEALHDETSSVFSDGYNGKWIENTVRVGAIFKF